LQIILGEIKLIRLILFKLDIAKDYDKCHKESASKHWGKTRW